MSFGAEGAGLATKPALSGGDRGEGRDAAERVRDGRAGNAGSTGARISLGVTSISDAGGVVAPSGEDGDRAGHPEAAAGARKRDPRQAARPRVAEAWSAWKAGRAGRMIPEMPGDAPISGGRWKTVRRPPDGGRRGPAGEDRPDGTRASRTTVRLLAPTQHSCNSAYLADRRKTLFGQPQPGWPTHRQLGDGPQLHQHHDHPDRTAGPLRPRAPAAPDRRQDHQAANGRTQARPEREPAPVEVRHPPARDGLGVRTPLSLPTI